MCFIYKICLTRRPNIPSRLFRFLQCAWMEPYQGTIGTMDMDQEQIVGLFNWRFVIVRYKQLHLLVLNAQFLHNIFLETSKFSCQVFCFQWNLPRYSIKFRDNEAIFLCSYFKEHKMLNSHVSKCKVNFFFPSCFWSLVTQCDQYIKRVFDGFKNFIV